MENIVFSVGDRVRSKVHVASSVVKGSQGTVVFIKRDGDSIWCSTVFDEERQLDSDWQNNAPKSFSEAWTIGAWDMKQLELELIA